MQDEFAFYMDDAQSKLLVTGPSGNEAAEGADKAPCVSLHVISNGSNTPSLEIKSRITGFEIPPADFNEPLPENPQPGTTRRILFYF